MVDKSVDDTNNFIIATFENGQLQSNQVDKLKCTVFKNKKNKRKLIAVATDKMSYVSTETSDSDLCHTLIMVKNKKTNKIRVVPVDNVCLKPVIRNDNLDSSFMSKSTVLELNRQFGNKKMKRKTEQIEKMKMNISNVEKELEKTVADIKINKEDLVIPTENEAVKIYRPPINRNASSVQQIYNLNSIVTNEELDTLSDVANEVLENDFEDDKFTPFVTDTIKSIKRENPPNKLRKCEILLYIDGILKFFKIPIKLIGKKNHMIEPYSETICTKINKEFTVHTEKSRTRPISMKDKATCYILVLSLIALDYKLNLEPLAKTIGIGLKRLCDFSHVIGAQAQSNKSKNNICLKLPLPAEPSLFSKKRK